MHSIDTRMASSLHELLEFFESYDFHVASLRSCSPLRPVFKLITSEHRGGSGGSARGSIVAATAFSIELRSSRAPGRSVSEKFRVRTECSLADAVGRGQGV